MREIILDVKNIIDKIEVEKFKDKTILLTGSSGLIGFYILTILDSICKEQNITVYAQYHLQLPAFDNIYNENIKFIQLDLSNFSEYSKIPRADIIIHTAGYAQPLKFIENNLSTLQINVAGTIALLKCLNENGSFVFLSSTEIYSGLSQPPFNEKMIGTSTTLHDRASYIEGKRGGESACFMMFKKGINAKSIRLGDIYGMGNRINDKRAIYEFMRKGIQDKKIDLLDSGSAIRTYCYVSDAVELIFKALFNGKEPIYNVAGKDIVTISTLAKKIGKILNVPINIPTLESGVIGAPKNLSVDVSLIQNEFNKNDYISLDEGLKRTIMWQKILYN